jgi:hypothetical protein
MKRSVEEGAHDRPPEHEEEDVDAPSEFVLSRFSRDASHA